MNKKEYPAEPTDADARNMDLFVLDYKKLYNEGMIELNHRNEFNTLDYVIIDEYPSSYSG